MKQEDCLRFNTGKEVSECPYRKEGGHCLRCAFYYPFYITLNKPITPMSDETKMAVLEKFNEISNNDAEFDGMSIEEACEYLKRRCDEMPKEEPWPQYIFDSLIIDE